MYPSEGPSFSDQLYSLRNALLLVMFPTRSPLVNDHLCFENDACLGKLCICESEGRGFAVKVSMRPLLFRLVYSFRRGFSSSHT